MAFAIASKCAIVTGGASGISLAFAKLLVQKGAKVVVADLQRTPALDELMKQRQDDIFFQKTDLTQWDQLHDLFKFTKNRLGKVDVLCNSAGVFEPPWSNFWKDTEETSYKSIDLNVSALMKGTRLAIRDQITRVSPPPSTRTVGVILNVSSLAAQFPLFNQPLYCSSKAAVSAFTRALAPLHKEFGIKVVAVAPGNVATPLWTEDIKKVFRADDVVIQPEEVADVMLRVIEGAEYPGGTVLEVTKGRTRFLAVDSPVASGPGATTSNMGVIYDETITLLDQERQK
ncbi:uncharacterized protein PV07_07465 [Cladophialophora immunda]|uniref:Uncharacterized protein n=1 Tax=Cladophialophora immunda TaxID=569365 RepID=A0A0D2ARL5_9EURO|nr:uncharacterized protein PV07_07465 [Cladophialophora immunda]KIW27757.1 hypothetical protein PV07_07465 [Cladophialophora immunda]OQV10074.1 hypothetical protein CLAIMM_14121 [Cladophialophora immunda]